MQPKKQISKRRQWNMTDVKHLIMIPSYCIKACNSNKDKSSRSQKASLSHFNSGNQHFQGGSSIYNRLSDLKSHLAVWPKPWKVDDRIASLAAHLYIAISAIGFHFRTDIKILCCETGIRNQLIDIRATVPSAFDICLITSSKSVN